MFMFLCVFRFAFDQKLYRPIIRECEVQSQGSLNKKAFQRRHTVHALCSCSFFHGPSHWNEQEDPIPTCSSAPWDRKPHLNRLTNKLKTLPYPKTQKRWTSWLRVFIGGYRGRLSSSRLEPSLRVGTNGISWIRYWLLVMQSWLK